MLGRKGNGKAKGRKRKKEKKKNLQRRKKIFSPMRLQTKNAIRKINADLYCYVSSNLSIIIFFGFGRSFLFPLLRKFSLSFFPLFRTEQTMKPDKRPIGCLKREGATIMSKEMPGMQRSIENNRMRDHQT